MTSLFFNYFNLSFSYVLLIQHILKSTIPNLRLSIIFFLERKRLACQKILNPKGSIKCNSVFVPAQVRAILPVFAGIKGSNKTIWLAIFFLLFYQHFWKLQVLMLNYMSFQNLLIQHILKSTGITDDFKEVYVTEQLKKRLAFYDKSLF